MSPRCQLATTVALVVLGFLVIVGVVIRVATSVPFDGGAP